MTTPTSPVELLVCTRCRLPDQDSQNSQDTEGAERPGAILFHALSATAPEGVTITPVECLSNCSRGCTIALRGPGRWTYIYGGLDAGAHVDTIVEGAARYREAPDGLVPWRARPEHFRKTCIARIPPLTPAAAPVPNLGKS